MIYQQIEGCTGCFRPDKKRLGTLQSNPEYECYGESYIKCFWGLCDQQKAVEAFVVNVNGPVITEQPRRSRRPNYSRYQIEN